MSYAMVNGLGFSRFMVQNFNQAAKENPGGESSPQAMSLRSTAEDDEEQEAQAREQRQTPRSMQVSYERVAQITSQAASRIDWRQLRNSTALWDEKKKLSASSSFSIFTRQSRGMHYVMAVGTISCSVSELRAILRPTTDAKYTAAMVELYGDAFVQGSIVHRSRPSSVMGNPNSASFGRSSTTTNTGGTFRSSQRYVHSGGNGGGDATSGNCSFMAKTATFAKTHVFAKAQQWAFLECYQQSPSQHGFSVTMSSLSPFFEIPGRVAKSQLPSQVEQLQGITAAYSVSADPHQPSGELQVTFYSKFAEDCTSFSPLKRHAFKATLKSHLMAMARATTRLPVIVRRKRLEVFSPSDTKVFTLSNPLCICCTATLHVFKAKTRCHACGYFVCDKCSIEQEVEVENPQMPIVLARVCQPCIRRVDEAIYERVSLDDDALDRATAATATAAATVAVAVPSSSPPLPDVVTRAPTSSMADLLDHIFHTGPEGKKQAVMSVIKYVLDDDDTVQRKSKSKKKTRTRTSSLTSHVPRRESLSIDLSNTNNDSRESFAHTDPRSEKDYLRALQTHLTLSHSTKQTDPLPRTDARACAYATTPPDDNEGDFTNSGGSNISIASTPADPPPQHVVPYKGRHDYRHAVTQPSLPAPPAPSSDARRSKAARTLLTHAVEDVSSLEIICSIACKELACAVAMVTVVEHERTRVVATNSDAFRHAVVPREESFCAYTVLSAAPLLVAHPEQDARFASFEIVQRGLRFYCGFPLTSSRAAVIGTLCCGDFASRDTLSPQQIDAMTKLAATASRVMQLRGKDVYKRL